jgi:hypothetical protein
MTVREKVVINAADFQRKEDTKMGVILSEKHGVNPTIPICFWCGKSKNEIALLGKMKGDVEAPRNMVLNYEPCDECKANMSTGVTFMEASQTPCTNGQPEMQRGLYPTGRWFVVKPEAVHKIINDADMADSIVKHGKTFVDVQTFNQLMPSK